MREKKKKTQAIAMAVSLSKIEYLFWMPYMRHKRKIWDKRKYYVVGELPGMDRRYAVFSFRKQRKLATGFYFLMNIDKKGLITPTTITTDGAPGLIKAVGATFPESLRIRCLPSYEEFL